MQMNRSRRVLVVCMTVSALMAVHGSALGFDEEEDSITLPTVYVVASHPMMVGWFMFTIGWMADFVDVPVAGGPSNEAGVTIEVKGEHEFDHSVTSCSSSMGVRANYVYNSEFGYLTAGDIGTRVTVRYPAGGYQRWVVVNATSSGGHLKAETACT